MFSFRERGKNVKQLKNTDQLNWRRGNWWDAENAENKVTNYAEIKLF